LPLPLPRYNSGVRTWLRRALWMAGIGALFLNVYDDPPLWSGPCVQDVGQRAATIAQITAAPCVLELKVTGPDGSTVHRSRDAEPVRRHAFRCEGLAPGVDYAFSLEGDGIAGTGRVRTAPADDQAAVRFAFCGDSGAQPWWVWLQRSALLHWPARWDWFPFASAVRGVGAAVAGYDPDFLLHLGDVIYPKGQHAHYRSGFFGPFAAALARAPFYAVVGNHDVLDADGQQVLANFRMPAGALTGDGRCFSFAWGPVRVIGLDCNTDRTGERYGKDHPSHAFLLAELAAASEPWVVVASHFPMRSVSRQGNRAELLLGLLPELATHGVDLYLSGHDHCYQRYAAVDGGPVLVVSGGGGKDLYDVQPASVGVRPAAAAKAFHWCSAEIARGRFEVVARSLGGELLDRFELPLATGDRLARIAGHSSARAARIRAQPR
jgi:acid phosphatase type 7